MSYFLNMYNQCLSMAKKRKIRRDFAIGIMTGYSQALYETDVISREEYFKISELIENTIKLI